MLSNKTRAIIIHYIEQNHSNFWDDERCDKEALAEYLIDKFKISKADRDEMWDLIHDYAEDDIYDSMGDMED